MGKFKMPTTKQFLNRKNADVCKRDPVWVYLEREMRANVSKKPYNHKVGDWLKFLKDLKYHYHSEVTRQIRRLRREQGPPWFVEFSLPQRKALSHLKDAIHADVVDDTPHHSRQILLDLGITVKIPSDLLLKAMHESAEEPGLFIWNLYSYCYKKPPSKLRIRYDMNSKLLMSALVIIDLDECIKELKNRTPRLQPTSGSGASPVHRKALNQAKHHSNYDLSVKVRSKKSNERLYKDTSFIPKRKERCTRERKVERVCKYKFWEPPVALRATNAKNAAYYEKLGMVKKKAKRRHLKYKSSYENVHFHMGTVAYTGGAPRYILNNIVVYQTGYIPIHGGLILFNNEYVTNILGHWEYPKHVPEECDSTCNCLNKWESTAIDYTKEWKCKCLHSYDHVVKGDEAKALETYVHVPTKYDSYWIDKAKVFSMDPVEDYIRDAAAKAERSASVSPSSSKPWISRDLPVKQLLKALLADLSETALVIPHLPKAYLLNNLLEWVRHRKLGKVTPAQTRKWLLQSQRRWLQLKHIPFRVLAFRIPFTPVQMRNLNWSHRTMIQKLFHAQLDDFVSRNRKRQTEQTRMWWSTMKYDVYPNKAFLDAFFTYMPAVHLDTYLINPYEAANTVKTGGRTCPL